jgi:ferric-dicitrate binding protein FerR (iron transport regulator)
VFRLLVPTLAWRKFMIAADDEAVAAMAPNLQRYVDGGIT